MKELLFSITKKDFEIQYFSGTGAGGQHRNKHQNCVRLKHIASGVTITGAGSKERRTNTLDAFRRLKDHPRFKLWHNQKLQEVLTGKTVEEKVDEMMQPDNLKIETKNNNDQWSEEGKS